MIVALRLHFSRAGKQFPILIGIPASLAFFAIDDLDSRFCEFKTLNRSMGYRLEGWEHGSTRRIRAKGT